jgi:hypothetical protein
VDAQNGSQDVRGHASTVRPQVASAAGRLFAAPGLPGPFAAETWQLCGLKVGEGCSR